MKSLLDYTDRAPMTEEQSEVLMLATMAEAMSEKCPDDILDLFGVKVMRKRLEIVDIPVSDWALFFLSSIGNGHPATLVMYAYVCAELYRKHKEPITVTHIVAAFPRGFPVESAAEKCWDGQKIPMNKRKSSSSPDNYLDYEETWLIKEKA